MFIGRAGECTKVRTLKPPKLKKGQGQCFLVKPLPIPHPSLGAYGAYILSPRPNLRLLWVENRGAAGMGKRVGMGH